MSERQDPGPDGAASTVEGGGDAPSTLTSSPPNTRLVAALVAVGGAMLLAIGAVAFLRDGDGGAGAAGSGGSETEWNGAALGEPRARPDFTLTDTEGRPFDFREETRGELTMLFFGYTTCPDICPIQMATLAEAMEQPGVPDPTVVFVSTDPQRDTPERLRSFLDNFNTEFVGLIGSTEEVAAAEQAAGVAPSMELDDQSGAQVEEGEDDYLVGHSSEVVAYTPDDRAHVTYPSGTRRQDWVDDIPRLAETYPGPEVAVTDAWVSVTGSSEVAAGYVTIENRGEDDTLISARSAVAGRAGLMTESEHGGHGDGMSELDVPAGTTTLEPGVAHIMLEDLARPLEPGRTVELELRFERAGTVTVDAPVLTLGEVVDRLDRGS